MMYLLLYLRKGVAASGGEEDALPYRAHKHALVRRQARLVHFFFLKTSPKVLDIVPLYIVKRIGTLTFENWLEKKVHEEEPLRDVACG